MSKEVSSVLVSSTTFDVLSNGLDAALSDIGSVFLSLNVVDHELLKLADCLAYFLDTLSGLLLLTHFIRVLCTEVQVVVDFLFSFRLGDCSNPQKKVNVLVSLLDLRGSGDMPGDLVHVAGKLGVRAHGFLFLDFCEFLMGTGENRDKQVTHDDEVNQCGQEEDEPADVTIGVVRLKDTLVIEPELSQS